MRLRGYQRSDGVFSPTIEVVIRAPGEPYALLAVVDSGADSTILSAEYLPASVTYADLPVLGEAQGVGGTFEIARWDVQVWFDKWKVCDAVQVIEPGKSPTPMMLLGRSDFFRRFTVYFDWHSQPGIVEIKRSST